MVARVGRKVVAAVAAASREVALQRSEERLTAQPEPAEVAVPEL